VRVLVIGCGSIGSRRARLLAEVGHEVLGFDPLRYASADPPPYPSAQHHYWQKADAAFICTPAETHLDIARECVEVGIPTFIEKPLALSLDGVSDLMTLAADRNVPVMVACNLRFAYGDVPPEDWPVPLLFWSHKPLRDWRPGAVETYTENGIIMESAIHELDLVYSISGPIQRAQISVAGNRHLMVISHDGAGPSVLDIDWSDSAETKRCAMVLGGGVAVPDLTDRMYELEMAHFLDCVQMGVQPCNTLADASHVLGWALHLRDELRNQ